MKMAAQIRNKNGTLSQAQSALGAAFATQLISAEMTGRIGHAFLNAVWQCVRMLDLKHRAHGR
nr:hypothetical protein [uncultured Ottowia sp.]